MNKKKILVLGSRIPYPTNDGGALACMQTLKLLSASNELTYFSFNTRKHFVSETTINREFTFCKVIPIALDATPTIWGALKAVATFRNYNLSRFQSNEAIQKLSVLLNSEKFDLIVFENIFTSGFNKTIQEHYKSSALIYRAHNVEWKIWEKLALRNSGIRRFYLKHLTRSFRKAEEKFISSVQNIAAITASDATYFKTINPEAKVITIPVGVEIDKKTTTPVQHKTNHTLYHLGSMEWLPNRDGLKWFISDVWPLVLTKFSDAELHIGGRNLNRNDEQFKARNVYNHGEISDASDFISQYDLCIVPIWSGSGLRIKTLEAMAKGKVVVTTEIGAEGIAATHGEHWFIAKNEREFAAYIIELMQSPGLINEISTRAKEFVNTHYSLTEIAGYWHELGV